MGTEISISEKIAKHKAKPPALSKKEKLQYKEQLKALAAEHVPDVVKTLAGIVKGGRDVPASAKVAAGSAILDRFAGKAKQPIDEKDSDREMDRMSEAQLIAFLCGQIAGMSQELRSLIAETLLYAQRGIALPDRFVDPDFSETAALRAEEEEEQSAPAGMPPLGTKRPKKEPRR